MLLWGDSNAAHYIGILGKAAEREGLRIRNLEVGSCPPLFTDPTPFVEARRLADCRASLAMVRPYVESFGVVAMGASWSAYQAVSPSFLTAVYETIGALTRHGAVVMILGKMPVMAGYDRRCREKALNHLSMRASWRMGETILRAGGVPAPLEAVARHAR